MKFLINLCFIIESVGGEEGGGGLVFSVFTHGYIHTLSMQLEILFVGMLV